MKRGGAEDWQTFSSDAPFRVPIPSEEAGRTIRQLPIETNPPEHTEWRAIVEPFFQRAKQPEMIAKVEAHWQSVGYEMIEAAFHFSPNQDELIRLLKRGDCPWIAQVFSRDFNPGGSVQEHLQTLRQQIDDCLPFAPVFFKAHSGADSWSVAETEEFYGRALEIEQQIGIPIAHETHRLRSFGNPWTTREILKTFPTLKLTVDLSQWVCVYERLLPDCGDIIELVAGHCHHLHARVGHEEGPQVPDPRAPEWAGHLTAHEAWWDTMWRHQRQRGMATSTLTPEFGPPPYMPTLPFVNEPVADLVEICDWVAQRQAERFRGIERLR